MKCVHGNGNPDRCDECKEIPDRVWKGIVELYRQEARTTDLSFILSATMGLLIRQCILHKQSRKDVVAFVRTVYDATNKELRG